MLGTDDLFYQLALVLLVAIGLGAVARGLRQPLIVAYILVGIVAGPVALGIIGPDEETWDLLATTGVSILLFLVGLRLDFQVVRRTGPVALASGMGQVFVTAALGYLIGLGLGLGSVEALYVAVALTFSSTIIIVKLLTDKKEVDSLHGRIAIGFLIVQDLVVVLSMMVLSAFGMGAPGGDGGSVWIQIAMVLLYGALMLLLVGIFIRYLALPITRRIARSPELLILAAIGWAAVLAALGDFLGFSKELGGLLAGMSLASTPFREAIVARLSSLRDFLLLFFFIALGSQLDLSLLGSQVLPALIFSLFVLVGNPLIVAAIMGYMGYRKRTGFLAGLTVAQISEFSLIFMAMGLDLGHVTPESLGLVTLVGLITISLSVYMITYSNELYQRLEPWLGVFERRVPRREEMADGHFQHGEYDVLLFGLGRYGSGIAERLCGRGLRLLALDFNPDEVRRWRGRGFDAMYGDATDQEFLAALPLNGVHWVVAAMPQHELGLTHEDPRLLLIDGLRRNRYDGRIAVSAHRRDEEARLREKGADLVFLPFQDAGERAVERLLEASAESLRPA